MLDAPERGLHPVVDVHFLYSLRTRVLRVLGLMKSISAIARLSKPRVISASTSASFSVRSIALPGHRRAVSVGGRRARSDTTRSPAWIRRSASVSWSASSDLAR